MHTTKETVLITGASGLLGRCLEEEVSRMSAKGETRSHASSRSKLREFVFVSSRDADLTNYEEARRMFEEHRPQHVIHLAAKVGGLYANMHDAQEGQFYKWNEKMNANVLKLSHEFQVKRTLSCMSTCIFPDGIELPLDESKLHLGPPHESNFGYAMAKRQLDLLNRHYNSKSDRLFFSIIPTNIYGPHDNFDLESSHVLAGLIHKAYKSCSGAQLAQDQNSTMLPVCGSGKPLRQFIYAPDLARLILWLLDEFEDKQEPLVITSPSVQEEISIGQAAELICKIFSDRFKMNLQIQLDPSKSDGQFSKTASNEKLTLMKPDFEFTPIESGLQKTVDWFCRHYPQVRGGGSTRPGL